MLKENNKNNKILSAIIITIIIIVLATALVLVITLKTKQTTPRDLDELVNNLKQAQVKKQQPDLAEESLIMRNGKMSLQTENNQLQINNEFEVKIYISTENSNIVLASAIIEYDSEYLELIYNGLPAKTENSVLNMSVVNQLKNNKIEVVLGAPGDTDYLDNDDGFNGQNGLLASLKFKALKSGNTKIFFSNLCELDVCDNSTLVLDDGKGTEMKVEFEDLSLVISNQ